MKIQEKQLILNLCNFRNEEFKENLLEYATPQVLGTLFFNRMQAVAYGVLKRQGLLGNINREFRNSIRDAYEYNLNKNRSYFKCIAYLNGVLSSSNCKFAMLKGAYLCGYYPEGYRTSNDIDILVLPENVTKIGNALLRAGFKQGNIRNGEFTPAHRKEIIESRMTRGETVPYIKQVDLPGMKYLEVDINFSLDYKNGGNDVLKEILNRSYTRNAGDIKVPTLDRSDFFIHLCSHLYKEATTLPWVEMNRDMTLYKYCDIYMLLSDMKEAQIEEIFRRAGELELDKICAFAVIQTSNLFDSKNERAIDIANSILKSDVDFIHKVVSPKDKKTLVYTEKDISKRFFAYDRKKLLKEV